jgi:hypothetical protein
MLLLPIGLCAQLKAKHSSAAVQEILQSLFPKSNYKEYDSFFGLKETNAVISPVELKGLHGFIPLKTTMNVSFNDSVSAICFLVYLCSEDVSLDLAITAKITDNPNDSKKILQIVFYNPLKETFLGKPDHFPLESTDWVCTGDACNSLGVLDFAKVKASMLTCYVIFEKNLSTRFIQVFRYGPKKIQSSDKLSIGSLGGESGCTIEIKYDNLSENADCVIAIRRTFCDTACLEICKRREMQPGEKAEKVIILKRESK